MQWLQRGNKLVGTGGVSYQTQGNSVALSANGSVLAVGGANDGGLTGATWLFVHNGTDWVQAGDKLVGTDGLSSNQGVSVALNANGTVLAVGGSSDNDGVGSTWVFVHNGTAWNQERGKLIGTGGTRISNQGDSVALNEDGTILAVGGPKDSDGQGATWIFVHNGTDWNQAGDKLVGAGGVGNATAQGGSVALSADGTVLAIGGPGDDGGKGATWLFTLNVLDNVWKQRGHKLVGTGGVGSSLQGASVALSASGAVLAVGGFEDDSGKGATWIFINDGAVWHQSGGKLVGTSDWTGDIFQGTSVALSSQGTVLAVGGERDDNFTGATWIFVHNGTVWEQRGRKLVGREGFSGEAGDIYQGSSVALNAAGSLLAVGGPLDNGGIGATWLFESPLSPLPEPTRLPTPVPSLTPVAGAPLPEPSIEPSIPPSRNLPVTKAPSTASCTQQTVANCDNYSSVCFGETDQQTCTACASEYYLDTTANICLPPVSTSE